MKLTLMRGLPGSGKSTAARAMVAATGNSGRINRDDLRAMLFDSVWTGKRESVVVDCEKAIAQVLYSLGDRMKSQYEDRYRISLPRRTYTIVRVDGKAFHSYTQGLEKPYDAKLMECMDRAALALCKEAAGAEMAFVQSDEISLLLTDFRKIDTHAWFDGNLQKLVSVCASVATMEFNRAVVELGLPKQPNALFDARVFIVPDPVEVDNYFRWRQKDAERNSVAMLAQSYASQKQLHGKDRTAQHDVIHEAGDNWNNHGADFKRGRAVIYRDMAWVVDHETPVFTQDTAYLKQFIPVQWAEEKEG